MSNITVSDTGPLLHLNEIGHVHLLTLFHETLITFQVETELNHYGVSQKIKKTLSEHIDIFHVGPYEIACKQNELFEFQLQTTDVSVAVLAARCNPDIVLTDDLELRKGLETMGFKVTGSVGILIRSYNMNWISKTELHN